MWQPVDGDSIKRLSIKDEPFEELYVVPEPLNYTTTESDGNSYKSCCLCREGSLLQHKLIDHIRAHHTDDGEILFIWNFLRIFHRILKIGIPVI